MNARRKLITVLVLFGVASGAVCASRSSSDGNPCVSVSQSSAGVKAGSC